VRQVDETRIRNTAPSHPSSENPYVFIVGCPRSGTTLLGRIVDAHPNIAVLHESRWIPSWYQNGVGLDPDGCVTEELVSKLTEYKRFPTLDLDAQLLEELISTHEPMSYAQFTTALFDLYGRRRGKRLVGDKTPRYVRDIPTLHELFPAARFVHIIRDGRDTALSIMAWANAGRTVGSFSTYAREPVATTALWWEWQVRLGRDARASLSPRLYREVRYESLVADPGDTCRDRCELLGVAFDDSMLRFHEGKSVYAPGLDAKKAWLPITSGLRDWRSQMTESELESFEASSGELLEALGYERAMSPSSTAMALASELRTQFVVELKARGRRVPAWWS
jgi:hypothetical protein